MSIAVNLVQRADLLADVAVDICLSIGISAWRECDVFRGAELPFGFPLLSIELLSFWSHATPLPATPARNDTRIFAGAGSRCWDGLIWAPSPSRGSPGGGD